MANAWLKHIKRWRAEQGEGMKYKDVLIEARKTYTSVVGSTTRRAPKAKMVKEHRMPQYYQGRILLRILRLLLRGRYTI